MFTCSDEREDEMEGKVEERGELRKSKRCQGCRSSQEGLVILARKGGLTASQDGENPSLGGAGGAP